ncbi:hypothetical protein DZC72_06945 [Maribacter algicola]|uniref:DUF1795 domain-containing protein n=1 Tax=Maribacter algicola TaxID=2498892 RepID=A0A426RMT5_9FLAO|nr:hypothetical protein [Maribacter algicola]RRQ50289.1 hypothetical protein DZC72_06945 [Maribacter algicola]
MKSLLKFILVILFVSCSDKQISLEQYSKYPVKFARKKITHPTNDFSVFIPKDWNWEIQENEYMDELILGLGAESNQHTNGFSDMILIEKLKSDKENGFLKYEYGNWLNGMKENLGAKGIVESGLSNFMNQNTYFIHSKYNNEDVGQVETVHLFIESGEKGIFYMLTASASQKKELDKKMASLVQCLKTFESLRGNKNNAQQNL